MAKKSKLNLSSPLLYIILGALLAIFGQGILGWAIYVVGVCFIVMGIVDVIGKRMTSAIVNIIIGIVIIALAKVINIIFPILGILVAIKGVMDLLEVMKRSRKSILAILVPVLTIVVGVGIAFGGLLGDVLRIVGVLLIIDGVLGFLGLKK